MRAGRKSGLSGCYERERERIKKIDKKERQNREVKRESGGWEGRDSGMSEDETVGESEEWIE